MPTIPYTELTGSSDSGVPRKDKVVRRLKEANGEVLRPKMIISVSMAYAVLKGTTAEYITRDPDHLASLTNAKLEEVTIVAVTTGGGVEVIGAVEGFTLRKDYSLSGMCGAGGFEGTVQLSHVEMRVVDK